MVLGVGTRLPDFTTGSRALFRNPGRAADRSSTCSRSTRRSTTRCRWSPTRGAALEALTRRWRGWRAPDAWARRRARRWRRWNAAGAA